MNVDFAFDTFKSYEVKNPDGSGEIAMSPAECVTQLLDLNFLRTKQTRT